MLRKHGVVGKFVEFYGEGVAQVPLANRATIGNMSPEFGSTCAIFPIDQVTLDYLRLTGRSEETLALVEAYAKEQGMWLDPAGPARGALQRVPRARPVDGRPVDRRPEASSGPDRRSPRPRTPSARCSRPTSPTTRATRATASSFPASDPSPSAADAPTAGSKPESEGDGLGRPSHPVPVTTASGESFEIDHGIVAIASITSCTNTSNPSVMMAAAMLAKNAVERGLTVAPWVKTSMAPAARSSRTTTRRPACGPTSRSSGSTSSATAARRASATPGPLDEEISAAVNEGDLAVVSVLSGNRNFEGRINPDVKMNYLASPPLVIAYALAGTMDFDFESEPLGTDPTGADVFLRDIWPDPADVEATIAASISKDMFIKDYADVFAGDERWQSLPTPEGDTFAWDGDSTYVRKPPYFDGMGADAGAGRGHRGRPGARQARGLGDDRPHQPARARSRPTAPPAATSPSTAWTARTSTPTARGVATTR